MLLLISNPVGPLLFSLYINGIMVGIESEICLFANDCVYYRQAKFVADDIYLFIYLFFFKFSKKTSLDISCESSAKQTIHMKYQDLFSLKN